MYLSRLFYGGLVPVIFNLAKDEVECSAVHLGLFTPGRRPESPNDTYIYDKPTGREMFTH